MAKIRREEVILTALEMLDEVGLDSLTTRGLARRLNVESPALYWHFRDKSTLLREMAAHVILTRHVLPIPTEVDAWPTWFAQNARQFRTALLAFRDGARLHAGTEPDARELDRVEPKLAYLEKVGIPRHEGLMALLAAGRFTLGCVLEEQAADRSVHVRAHDATDTSAERSSHLASVVARSSLSHSEAFDFGIELLVHGLRGRIVPPTSVPKFTTRKMNNG